VTLIKQIVKDGYCSALAQENEGFQHRVRHAGTVWAHYMSSRKHTEDPTRLVSISVRF